VFRATGKGAVAAFRNEAGGHRHQRVPPTEKRGRVQTSTVTVAVLPVPSPVEVRIDERDLDWTTCRAGGKGGQNVAKTETAVQVTHLPTGLQVRCENERSQKQNLDTAMAILRAKLLDRARNASDAARNGNRRAQLGSGQRGDKTRTYRWQDGIVTQLPNDN
jgi:peptide chain release factor 1